MIPLPTDILYCTPPNTAWERKRIEVNAAAMLGRRVTRKDRKYLWRAVLRDVEGRVVGSDVFRLER
ncbi:MAG: hypothetical protein IPP83_09360 [Flavobacteriales bacterium]|nr:hypothetical protein [Flavobacteriales bacterium]